MSEELLPGLHRIEVPLPRHPMKSTNSYAIVAGPRNLVIDTGIRDRQGLDFLLDQLAKLGVDVHQTDFFITHYHSDHFGLVPELIEFNVRIFMGAIEIARLQSGPFWEGLIEYARSWGCSDKDLHNLLLAFEGTYRFDPTLSHRVLSVNAGDTLTYADYEFVCILTPGHTPGHLCLHEPSRGLLICGDHLLPDVAPFIQVWSETGNPLKEHFESLDRTNSLQPKKILPGHGKVFTDAAARAKQVRKWHERRATKVFSALKERPMTAVEAAAVIRSKVPPVIEDEHVKSFHQFIEVAETMAYLRYLERDGLIEERMADGTLVFTRNP